MNTPIIAVTGTKGKTTTVAVIADVLRKMQKNVLKVDTTGHFVNGQRRSTLDDSKRTWRLVPTVAPGRYLYEFFLNPELNRDGNGVAVLEAALGSSASSGLGYRHHEVGVFLNVFEDHLGSSDRLKTQQDIADAKQFIFERIEPEGGYAVFNADDALVVNKVALAPKAAVFVPVGLTFSAFDITAHLEKGGVAFTVDDAQNIVLRKKDGDTIIARLKNIPWTFGGSFGPSVWNLLSATGALYGYYKGIFPEGISDAIESVRLDLYGGRLTVFRAENGATVIADYAHEKVSLKMVADLARTQVQPEGKVIGVVRLAHDRTDELIHETGVAVGEAFDELVVYEKIDGYWRQPVEKAASKFKQVIGRTSQHFYDGIKEVNENATRILREDEAIAHAAAIAKPEDVVVVIVNDDIERSIGFIKEAFRAEFI